MVLVSVALQAIAEAKAKDEALVISSGDEDDVNVKIEKVDDAADDPLKKVNLSNRHREENAQLNVRHSFDLRKDGKDAVTLRTSQMHARALEKKTVTDAHDVLKKNLNKTLQAELVALNDKHAAESEADEVKAEQKRHVLKKSQRVRLPHSNLSMRRRQCLSLRSRGSVLVCRSRRRKLV